MTVWLHFCDSRGWTARGGEINREDDRVSWQDLPAAQEALVTRLKGDIAEAVRATVEELAGPRRRGVPGAREVRKRLSAKLSTGTANEVVAIGAGIAEFRSYLACGRLEHGFIRVKCDGCRHELLGAFSCKILCLEASVASRPLWSSAPDGAGPAVRVPVWLPSSSVTGPMPTARVTATSIS